MIELLKDYDSLKNHRKIMRVTYNRALDLFCGKTQITNLPDGSMIHSVGVSDYARCFDVVILNTAFSEVHEGIQPPYFMAEIQHVSHETV